MTTRDFLDALAPHADAPLHFDSGAGPVAPGYHVTEFKAVSVQAVDCGGATTRWNETVVQVVPPRRPEPQGMTVGKFLSIWRRVEGSVPVDDAAPVRVETPAADGVAVGYLVDAVEAAAAGITVRLAAPGVACKGIDRSVGDIPVLAAPGATAGAEGGCCGSAPNPRRPAEGTSGSVCCG